MLALALAVAATEPARAADCVVPKQRHPWGAFLPGSWKQVRVTTDTLNAAGEVAERSITETRSKITDVRDDSYELEINVTVEVGGKRFASDTRTSRHGFHGESAGQIIKIRPLDGGELRAAGETLGVERAEIEISDDHSRRVMQMYYSPMGRPHVLARTAVWYDAAGKVVQETDVTTLSRNVSRRVLGFQYSTWSTRTVQKTAAGKIVTDELHAAEVPGSVFHHSSEEFDADGKLIRRSTLELQNFGVATAAPAPRKRRHDKAANRRTVR
jgi:hypothetical protein